MTLVAHTVTTGISLPSGTRPGDYVIVITVMPYPRIIPPSASWLRHIGMGVYAGKYPSSGDTLPALGVMIILVYRPDPGETLTAFVKADISPSNTTGQVSLPETGDLWGVFFYVSSSPTWQGSYSPTAYSWSERLAYARLANIQSGEVALSATRFVDAYTLAIAVYPATGAAPDPSAWTQAIEGRAKVVVGGTDISEHVLSVEVVDELDAPGPTATLLVDRNALHPDLPGSPLRLAAPVEIVGLYRPVGSTTWQETPMLIGRVGAIDPSRHEMLVQVYDASEELLSTWFENEIELIETERLATRLSKMLFQAKAPVCIYESSVISVGGPQRFGRRPIWEMLRESAAYCGGSRLRWRYDYPAKTWRLVLYTPDRSANTPNYVFGTNDIIDLGASRLGLEDVRNVVQVVYGPPTERYLLTAEDPSSIAQYGRRMTRIEEASDSVVDTQFEAQALAAAVLADLSQPMRGVRLSIPWAPFVRVHDVVRINADGHVLKQAITGGVSRVRHRLSREEARTELEVQGNRNPGLYRYWLSREAGRPGVVAATPNWRPSTPITPLEVQAVATPRGIFVTWPEERDPHYVETLIYLGTSYPPPLWGRASGTFAMISALSDGSPLIPGATYYVQIAHRYADGRVSDKTAPVQVTATASSDQNAYMSQWGRPFEVPVNNIWVDVDSAVLSFTLQYPATVLLGYFAEADLALEVHDDTSPPTYVLLTVATRLAQSEGPIIWGLETNTMAQSEKRIYGTHAFRGEGARVPITVAHPFKLLPGTYSLHLQAYKFTFSSFGEVYTQSVYIYSRRIYAFVVSW